MTVATLQAELEGVLHGTTLNKIQNIEGVFNRAARQFLLDIDPQETKRIVPTTTPIYNQVYDYACPSDLKGNKVIDIRPQVNRTPSEVFGQAYNQDFDRNKGFTFQDSFTINFNTAVKTIRINDVFGQEGIVINSANSITDNGTWAIDGVNATNLTVDNVNFVANSSSLTFDLNAGGAGIVGYLQNSDMTAIDLSDDVLQSSIFFYVYLPTASNFTNIIIRWGSSSTNYYTVTMTTNNEGTTFQDGWNLMRADWDTATTVGTPDSSAIDYLRISYTYNGTAMNGVKLDSVSSILGRIMQIEYYSKYLFRSASTGAFQETTTDSSDLINLDTESYNIYFWLVCLYAIQQALGGDSGYDTSLFTNSYNAGVARYKEMYKSEVQQPQTIYYSKPNRSFGRYLGDRWN